VVRVTCPGRYRRCDGVTWHRRSAVVRHSFEASPSNDSPLTLQIPKLAAAKMPGLRVSKTDLSAARGWWDARYVLRG
jgi:hypothetical protein